MDSVFIELIWKNGVARIRLQALRRPGEVGGMALPDPRCYFLVTQLQYMGGSNRPGERGAGSNLLLNDNSHDTIVETVEADSFGSKCPTTQLMVKSWESVKNVLGYVGFSEFSPLWDNKNLNELKVMGGMGPAGYSLPGTAV